MASLPEGALMASGTCAWTARLPKASTAIEIPLSSFICPGLLVCEKRVPVWGTLVPVVTPHNPECSQRNARTALLRATGASGFSHKQRPPEGLAGREVGQGPPAGRAPRQWIEP